MGMLLLDQDEARERQWRMIDSREWWVIPLTGDAAHTLSLRIEDRYYAGAANADFELMLCPPHVCGVASVAFARKRRMTARALATLMRPDDPAALSKQLAQQDIVIAQDGDGPNEDLVLRMNTWAAWVQPPDGDPE